MRTSLRRATTTLVSVGVVMAVVVSGLLGTSTDAPALRLAPVGHWVFNQVERTALHVDSGTGRVDAAVVAPSAGLAGMALQGADRGYLVAGDRVTVFGRSTLTVDSGFTVPGVGDEIPVGIETVGGPYLVYRGTGVVVRLGEPPTTVRSGGPLDRPTYTEDGTVWVQRSDTGAVCRLAPGSDRVDCVADHAPDGRHALTVVDGVAGVVDLTTDSLTPVSATGSGTPRPLGVDLPDDARVADRTTTDGMLPVITANPPRLMMLPVGAAAIAHNMQSTTVDLPPGSYQEPLTSDANTAVVNSSTGTLATFSSTGAGVDRTTVAPGTTPTRMSRGADGHVYLDDDRGSHTYVVDGRTGTIASVGTATPAVVTVAAPEKASVPAPPLRPTAPLPGEPTAPTRTAPPSAPLPGPAPSPNPSIQAAAPDVPAGGGATEAPAAPAAPADITPAPPGAPTGLTATTGAATDARTVTAEVTWQAPAGAVTGYQLDVDGQTVARPTGTTATVTLPEACAAHTVAVRAVSGGTATGPSASTTTAAAWTTAQCGPAARVVTAQPGAGRSITVGVTGEDTEYLEADCRVLVDGTQAWQGTCVDATAGLTITAPAYDTAYTVTVRATNDYGTATSNAVSVRTGADPTAPTTPAVATPGPQQIVYRVSSQNGGTSHTLPTGGSISQTFTANVGVIDTIGAIVGIGATRDPGAAHTITLQVIGGGQVLASGDVAIVNNKETRYAIPGGLTVTNGNIYTLRAINTSTDDMGFYTNPPGTGVTPDVAPSSARAQITGEGGNAGTVTSPTSAMSGIVLGYDLQ